MTNEQNLTPELLEQAKTAPSAAALLALAQERGITLTAEQAAAYYAQLHPEMGAISDEELDNVSGGCFGSNDDLTEEENAKYYPCSCGCSKFKHFYSPPYIPYCKDCKKDAVAKNPY